MFNAKDGSMSERKDRPGGQGNAPRTRRAADDPVAAGLRRLWSDVEAEPVPDEFLRLLDAIDEARTDRDAGSGKGERA